MIPSNSRVRSELFKEKPLSLSLKMGIPYFSAAKKSGKKRKYMVYKSLSMVFKCNHTRFNYYWMDTEWRTFQDWLKFFDVMNILNYDKTSLFYHVLWSKIMDFKRETCHAARTVEKYWLFLYEVMSMDQKIIVGSKIIRVFAVILVIFH